MSQPKFTYCPNPIACRVVERSHSHCSCCGLSTEFVYTGSIDGELSDAVEVLCPDCIASGLAASKYQIVFNTPDCLQSNKLPQTVIDEVVYRTPSYSSWQQQKWLCHCEDACEFHGDLSLEEAGQPDWTAVAELLQTTPEKARITWPHEKITVSKQLLYSRLFVPQMSGTSSEHPPISPDELSRTKDRSHRRQFASTVVPSNVACAFVPT